MSVIYSKNNSPFSLANMADAASLAGIVTGQPWLTVLGQGVNAFGQSEYQTPGFQNTNNGGFLGSLGLGQLFSGINADNITQGGK